jgi:error-prone DNA polymerase
VPIFQEQVMQLCVIAAGFTPGEADGLRRAMAAWRRDGHVDQYEQRIKTGMTERGYDAAFAEALFRQICGFGEYGFPESHAYSFALLAYISLWMKVHEPAIFLAALINSQPMGFYAPAQLVQDARRHGVDVRAVDVMCSEWDCTLEAPTPVRPEPVEGPPPPPFGLSLPFLRQAQDDQKYKLRTIGKTPFALSLSKGVHAGFDKLSPNGGVQPAIHPAIRLGLRLIDGLPQAVAERIAQARRERAFTDLTDLATRAQLDPRDLQTLARADALQSLAGHRRHQLWQAAGQERGQALLAAAPITERAQEQPDLFEAPEGEAIALDYASTGLTLRRHPLALLRARIAQRGWKSAAQLMQLKDGARATACGIVTMRQQPETAKGVIFVTLEDETGSTNVIVWRHVRERHRIALLRSRLLAVAGEWQTREGVTHLIAKRLEDMTPWLGAVATSSRDFH